MKLENLTNKQLYKISQYCYTEAFLNGQMRSAGSNVSRFMEKMNQDKDYMHKQSRLSKIFVSIYIAFMIFIPIEVFVISQEALQEGIDPNWILLMSALFIGSFFLLQVGYMMIYGLFFSSSLMSGEQFEWLTTLPLEKRELEKIGIYTFFRGMSAVVITLILVFPIGMAIVTQSFILTLIGIAISSMNAVFALSVLIILGAKLNQIFNDNEINSPKTNRIRMFVNVSFGLMAFIIVILFNFAINSIVDVMTQPSLASSSIQSLNDYLPAIPFLNQAYLVLAIDGYEGLGQNFILTLIIGIFIMVGITRRLFEAAQKEFGKIIQLQASSAENTLEFDNQFDENYKGTIDTEGISFKPPKVQKPVLMEISSPIRSYIRKDLMIATREMSTLMILLLPLIFPIIGIFTMQEMDMIALIVMNLMYSAIGAMMIANGLTSMEESGATTTASLPIIERDRALGKIAIITSILTIGMLLPAILIMTEDFFRDILIYIAITFPIASVLGIGAFLLKVRLFSKLKYKYVLEEMNQANKAMKFILIGFLVVGVIIIQIAISAHFLDQELDYISFASVMIPFEFGLLLLEIYSFGKMFPKPRISL